MDFLSEFLETASKHPARVSIHWRRKSLSYGFLDSMSGRIADSLSARVAPDSGELVALSLARTPILVASMLACARVGCGFAPLDRTMPPARLRQMLGAISPAAVLDDGRGADLRMLIDGFATPVDAGDISELRLWISRSRSLPRSVIQGCAYAMLTSGSTRAPQVVPIHRDALSTYFSSLLKLVPLDAQELFCAHAKSTFDPSIRELLLPLGLGASIWLLDDVEAKDPGSMLAAFERVTAVPAMTPSWMRRVLYWRQGPIRNQLRYLFVSGEPFPSALYQAIRRSLGPHVRVFNMYGSTESTLTSTSHECTSEDEHGLCIPVGRPLRHNNVQILDDARVPVPFGEIGEIAIASRCVSVGYLNGRTLDKERFLQEPSGDSRLFLTRDLGRWNSDGELELHARKDRQVKVRGQRVSLAEVEAVFEKHPQVVQAVAVLPESGDSSLAVHLKTRQGHRPAESDLFDLAKTHLADYMIPARIVFRDTFPVNAHGKVDYETLRREPLTDVSTTDAVVGAPPPDIADDADRFCRLIERLCLPRECRWSEPLAHAGGDSLSLLDFMIALEAEFGTRPDVQFVRTRPIQDVLRETLNPGARQPQQSIAPCVEQGSTAFELTGEPRAPKPRIPENVLITGATGFLGAFVLAAVRDRWPDARVIAMSRGRDDEHAHARLRASLEGFELSVEQIMSQTTALAADLSLPRLGLSPDTFSRIASGVDVVIHSAAKVSMVLPLSDLHPANVTAVHRLTDLLGQGCSKALMHISTDTAIAAAPAPRVEAAVAPDPRGWDGYSRSKWEAEQTILANYARGWPTWLIRPCRLFSASSGAVNPSDLIVQFLLACIHMQSVVILPASLNLIRVDEAAAAVVALTGQCLTRGLTESAFHLVPRHRSSLGELASGLCQLSPSIQVVSPAEWEQRLEMLRATSAPVALRPLLALTLEGPVLPRITSSLELDGARTRTALRSEGLEFNDIDLNDLRRIHAHFERRGFLPATASLRGPSR